MLNLSGRLSSSYRAFRHFVTLESRLDSIDARLTEVEKNLIAAHEKLDILLTQTRAHDRAHDQSVLDLRGFIAEETDRLDQYVNYHVKSLKKLIESDTTMDQ